MGDKTAYVVGVEHLRMFDAMAQFWANAGFAHVFKGVQHIAVGPVTDVAGCGQPSPPTLLFPPVP